MRSNRLLLIVNPQAGQRRIIRKLADVLALFCAAEYEPLVFITAYIGHARELAHKYAPMNDLVVCAGGDGTLNEVVAGVLTSGANAPIGYIPCGTTNDLANSLGLSKDIEQAVNDILGSKPYPLDIGTFNGRHFVYTASFGAFTRVSYSTPQNVKNVLGHIAYLLEGLFDLPQLQPTYARIKTDAGEFSGDYLFGAVNNSTSLAGILTLDKELVMLDDGKFELLLVDMPRNAFEVSQLLVNIAQRKYEGLIHLISVKSIDVETKEDLDWTLDGEYEKGGTKFHIENLHSAIRIHTRGSEILSALTPMPLPDAPDEPDLQE